MPTLILNDLQTQEIKNTNKISNPTNTKYVEETEKNNETLRQRIYEYTEAYKNASKYFIK